MNKSVKSRNQCKSLPRRQAGVIQTSYYMIKAHGGTITVNSEEYAGTEFIIELPLTNKLS